MYKAFIEPDLQTAHIKIINKFNPFTGFQNPTYILKVKLELYISISEYNGLSFCRLFVPLYGISFPQLYHCVFVSL